MELKEELQNQKPSLEGVKHTATKAKARQIQLIKRQQPAFDSVYYLHRQQEED